MVPIKHLFNNSYYASYLHLLFTPLNNLFMYLDPIGMEPPLDEGEEEGGDTLHLKPHLYKKVI